MTKILGLVMNLFSKKEVAKKVSEEFDKVSTAFSEGEPLGLSKILDSIGTFFSETLGESFEDVKEALKSFWNISEETVEEYSFESSLTWFKKNLNKEKHSAGCLYVADAENGKEITLLFLDKENNPLIDGFMHVVYAKNLDKNLQKQLAGKNMLVLR